MRRSSWLSKRKKKQENARQGKKKSVALKGTQGDSSTEDSDLDDEDFTLVIREAKKMRRKFYKKKGFGKPNVKKDESSSSTCLECNKPIHIKKDCPILKDKSKKSKKKKALYVGWDESEPSDSKDEKTTGQI